MKKITAEVLAKSDLSPQDIEKFIQWSLALSEKNNFDPQVMFYPRTVIFRVQADGEPIVFLPAQNVLMYESLAPKPGLTPRQTALSLREIGTVGDQICRDSGVREQYFLTNDLPEVRACEKRGWIICLYDPEKKTWLMKHRVQP